jgi:hypothetical protein
MSKIINAWHPEYAAEIVNKYERMPDGDILFAKSACSCGNVIPLVLQIAEDIGDVKLLDIARTVSDIESEREARGNRCKRKVTEPQRFVLGTALLERYMTARGIAAAAWLLTDADIEAAG